MATDVLYQPFPMQGAARGYIWHHRPETRRPRHFHAEPELNLITAGTARFGIGRGVVSVGAGDLLWFSPGQDHALLDASADFDLYVIGLAPALSDHVLGSDLVWAYAGPSVLHLGVDALTEMAPLWSAPLENCDPSAVDNHVGALWRKAHSSRATFHRVHPFTRRALGRLSETPDLSRRELARLARAAPTEVSRHFHQDMSLTLTAYRTRLRLLRFIDNVDGGAGSLLGAALDAGFGSYSQCHRTFTQTLGVTPRVFFGTSVREHMRDAIYASGGPCRGGSRPDPPT